ncbi:MAG: methylmalonyl-CoA mutase [Deltaproteobacteria bacterium]|nr:methylmalonyl-CoA mutase [Deltaproteobacteria bacterium]MBW1923773.1 methylmalonyl-CoA mutase [Deltaproteobacteria bacterium]MBW1949030.1 methylmalonyl-CoA mutase [Deltaproteobacteria bacterium]MBW2007176.1 methylmalonyl-CoA mutase [Deltaproteobacteria bacterium]MBW2101409.1 methylmalonyl-CoA mutase [Deltaproteobacteria bacterium]
MTEQEDKIKAEKKAWEEGALKKAMERFSFLQEPPARYYTPLDRSDFDFLEKVGFPGQYPFTAGTYPFDPMAGLSRLAAKAPQSSGLTRAAMYSGYGTPEDTRDYYRQNIERGVRQGPNLAMDLPTQCGYDSDNELIEGEVGKVGVAIDTLRDLEVIYEPYQGDLNLDNIASNFTVNASAIYLIAMYVALAEKRGIPIDRLRATPQNDILKEYIARGTYIFPPGPAMRLFRDTLVFITRHMPRMNITSMGGYHIREAGATRVQDLAFSLSIATAYIQAGVDAGQDVDAFAPRFTFNAFGGSMEVLKEIAFQRAARRMYARLLKERFGAKDPRSMIIRQPICAHIGPSSTTKQRPLNNVIRATIGAMAGAMSGGPPAAFPPYDEPLGLGWSREAQQLAQDTGRILACEARILDVVDPFAGSYYMEAQTDEIEAAAQAEMDKIDGMGGIVAAIEKGYVQRAVSRSAYKYQRAISNGDIQIVGVNCFIGENELEVQTNRLVPHPYDPERRARAEERQIANLKEVKRMRDQKEVRRLLGKLEQKAKDERENLLPLMIECAKAYVTLQEVCDVLRGVFGEYEPPSIF